MPTQRKATNPNDWTLSEQQQTAVALIIGGKNYQETADILGVNRSTVSQWANHDPAFMAEVNRRRQDLWREVTDGIRALAPKALAVLREELEKEGSTRLQAAVHVLRATGLYGAIPPPGPTDPRAIALERQLKEDDAAHAAEDAELTMKRKQWDRTLARLTDPLPGVPSVDP